MSTVIANLGLSQIAETFTEMLHTSFKPSWVIASGNGLNFRRLRNIGEHSISMMPSEFIGGFCPPIHDTPINLWKRTEDLIPNCCHQYCAVSVFLQR